MRHAGYIRNSTLYSQKPLDDHALGDPMAILVYFMRNEGMRLMDLFAYLDNDKNTVITRQEFAEGMKVNL